MGFIGGDLRESFIGRVKGADPGRLLAVPIDVGKKSAAAMVCDFWGEIISPPFAFETQRRRHAARPRKSLDRAPGRAGARQPRLRRPLRFGRRARGRQVGGDRRQADVGAGPRGSRLGQETYQPAPGRKGRALPLSGILYCGHCGRRLVHRALAATSATASTCASRRGASGVRVARSARREPTISFPTGSLIGVTSGSRGRSRRASVTASGRGSGPPSSNGERCSPWQ